MWQFDRDLLGTFAGWTFYIGVFYGIAAAVLNVYKVYKKAKKELDELVDDPKYTHLKTTSFNNNDD